MTPPVDRFPASVFVRTPEQLQALDAVLSKTEASTLEAYRGFVRVRVTAKTIQALRKKGFEVETDARPAAKSAAKAKPVAAAAAAAAPPSLPPTVVPSVRRSKRTDPALQERFQRIRREVETQKEAQGPGWHCISFTTPLSRKTRGRLSELGVRLGSYTKGWYRARIDASQIEKVRAVPTVREIRPYELIDRVSTELLTELENRDRPGAALAGGPAPNLGTFDAMLLPDVNPEEVAKAIQAVSPEIQIVETIDLLVRFRMPVREPMIARILRVPGVDSLGPYAPPALFCDRARRIVGVETDKGKPLKWTGRGQIVGVFDSGIDDQHPDFGGAAGTPKSRIAKIVDRPGCPPTDGVGHGTHVAGTIAGTGAASNGKVRGMAPDARLVVVPIVDQQGASQLPADLGALFKLAVAEGAKILNCSWARGVGTGYDALTRTADRFAYENPDVLLVVAAGNQGSIDAKGTVELRSVASPANAKNVLTVGACGSDRPDRTKTWFQYDARFGVPPTKDQRLAPFPEGIAALSSRGPTPYESVKPDLVAPGTWVLAPRGPVLLGFGGWEECKDHGNRYVFMHGTSMATPIVSGAAAVVRQFLVEEKGLPNPSAALMRAILISATRRLAETPHAGTSYGYPDFDQGYGRLDLGVLLPPIAGKRDLLLVDVSTASPEALEAEAPADGARASLRRYSFEVPDPPAGPLSITLAWTDPPANDLQNDLQLRVLDPDDAEHYGNEENTYLDDRPQAAATGDPATTDRHTPIEQVRVDKPKAGTWRVRVWARNTGEHPQGYALAICGPVRDLQTLPG